MIYAAITSAQPNHPSEDAWPLYEKAAAHIAEGDRQGKSSPAASNLEYLDFPPFPPEWHRLAKQAYEFNTFKAMMPKRLNTSVTNCIWRPCRWRATCAGSRNRTGPPADAWGALGYALIKGGLPDGSDRPLVYSHIRSKEGMFYRIDEPQYGFYVDDGTTQPANLRKEGGQFRDVSLWAPAKNKSGPTTRPLQ